MEIGQPTEPVTQRPARLSRLFQMLMRPLQRRDRKPLWHTLTRRPQHPALVAPVAMQRDEQRRGRLSRSEEIVIKLDLRRQRALGGGEPVIVGV